MEIGELHNHVSSSSIGLESTKKGQIINRELKTNLEFDDEVMDRLRESLSVSLELRALLQQNGVNNNARLSNAYTSSSVDWDSLEDFVLEHLDGEVTDRLCETVVSDLERVRVEVEDWRVYKNIVQALSHGGVTGPRTRTQDDTEDESLPSDDLGGATAERSKSVVVGFVPC